jgi:hypothetical protein
VFNKATLKLDWLNRIRSTLMKGETYATEDGYQGLILLAPTDLHQAPKSGVPFSGPDEMGLVTVSCFNTDGDTDPPNKTRQ